MRYYIIAGEASGDLHASGLMSELSRRDKQAVFRFFGGDCMQRAGGEMVKHYRDMAYMGFIPVLLHLNTIFKNLALAKRDLASWHADVVILVDYPGFNLKIAKFAAEKLHIPVYYYISPKIWAWKEWRIKSIKRHVKELFSILPFEKAFFEGKHHYPIHYVGNPTKTEVTAFKKQQRESRREFLLRYGIREDSEIIALLSGSRKQEIKDNLPMMLQAAMAVKRDVKNAVIMVAGAPSVDRAFYQKFLPQSGVTLTQEDTYNLLSHARAALVTSGTATLEAALFNVPEVVCYETPLPSLIAFLKRHILSVRYISLVNLIADREVVKELVADQFTLKNIYENLSLLFQDSPERKAMLHNYAEVNRLLGDDNAPEQAAKIMIGRLKG